MICSLRDVRAGIRIDENGALAAPAPTANSGAGARRRCSVRVTSSRRPLVLASTINRLELAAKNDNSKITVLHCNKSTLRAYQCCSSETAARSDDKGV